MFRRLARGLLTLGAIGAGGATVSLTGMALWTRNCTFVPFGPETDPLFKHQILKQINPYNKPVSSDSCVRTIPYSKIKPALLEDAQKGGAKLMEAFCAGMWGGYGKKAYYVSIQWANFC